MMVDVSGVMDFEDGTDAQHPPHFDLGKRAAWLQREQPSQAIELSSNDFRELHSVQRC